MHRIPRIPPIPRLPQLLAAALLAAPLLAAADPLYTVIAVAGAGSSASDLNNLGQVVGTMPVGGGEHAFVSSGAGPTDLGALGAGDSYAAAINDHGQIVGNAIITDANGDQVVHGFIYSGGSLRALPGNGYLTADAINNAGTVAGSMSGTGWAQAHAYTYAGGSFTDLGMLPIGDGSRALGINGAGDVVGAATNMVDGAPNFPEDPFLYHKGKMIDLGTLDPNGIWSGATAINDHGQIVGYAGISDPANPAEIYPQTAFLYQNGVLTKLGGLAPHWSSTATDINNLGQIVGSANLSVGSHGFLYENGKMIDLNSLIDPALGWTIEGANAINDLQQIAATACRDGVCEAVRLDLVSAVPEPPAYALLLAGLALGGGAARRFSSRAPRRRG